MNQQETKLQGEILEDAKAKAERILARAKNDAEQVIQKASQEAQEKHQQRIQDAKDEARRQTKTILAGIDMEIDRRWLNRQELCIDDVLQQALKDTAEENDAQHEKSLQALAEEAIKAIGNEPAVVKVNPADKDCVTSDWIREIARQNNAEQDYEIILDPKVDGGLVLQTRDGRKTFDNTYRMRLLRMKEQLRLMLVNGKGN